MATARQSRAARGLNIFFVNSRRCGPEEMPAQADPGKGAGVTISRGFAPLAPASRAAPRYVTEHVARPSQEYDAVPGRIRAVPFQLVVGDLDFGADLDMRPLARL